MSKENLIVPSVWGVAVGRQLLRNRPTTETAFSTGVSSEANTAEARDLVNPARSRVA